MYLFMLDHPLIVILGSFTLMLASGYWIWLTLHAPVDPYSARCTRCGLHCDLNDLPVVNESWRCPRCKMDESGLVIYKKEDQNRP